MARPDVLVSDRAQGPAWVRSSALKTVGMTDRRIHHWVKHGVFGDIEMPGSGNYLAWHPIVLDMCRVLMSVATSLCDEGCRGSMPPTTVLRKIVEHWDDGEITLGEHVIVRWQP